MTKLAELTGIKTLEGGWLTLTEAAEILGYTRSYMYKKAVTFNTLRSIGDKSSYVVNRSEVDKVLAGRTMGLIANGPPIQVKAPRKKKVSEGESELSMEQVLASLP